MRKKEWMIALINTVLGVIVLGASEYLVSRDSAIQYNIELWIYGSRILDFFFPLLVTLPFTWILFYEKKNGFIRYASVRINRKKYIAKKIATGAGIVFIMVFVIYFTGLIIAEKLLHPELVDTGNMLYKYVWGNEQIHNPFVFGALWCLWKAFIGSVICVFGYCIAMLADNLFVVSLMPFLYCMAENFITGTLGIEQYSIYTSFILNRLSANAMKAIYYLVGVLSFLVIGNVIVRVWRYKKKRAEDNEAYD